MDNPFVILESLHEHIGATFVAGGVHQLNEQGEVIAWPVGSVPYHLQAAQDSANRLFQALVARLPDEYARYTGD